MSFRLEIHLFFYYKDIISRKYGHLVLNVRQSRSAAREVCFKADWLVKKSGFKTVFGFGLNKDNWRESSKKVTREEYFFDFS